MEPVFDVIELQSAMYQFIGNMPKACPYVMAWFYMGSWGGEKTHIDSLGFSSA